MLKPIETPEGLWQVIGVDLITQLPKSNNYDAILTVVDHFSKQVHILPCLTSCSTDDVMDLLYHHVFKLHRLPRKIISDWGPQFASKLMQGLYEQLGIEGVKTSGYHPEVNRQTERMNQEVEQYLRLYTSRRQDDWVKHLPLAEFAINSREHSATHQSPFFMLYGYHPTFQISLPLVSQTPAVDERLKALKEVQEDTQGALELAAE